MIWHSKIRWIGFRPAPQMLRSFFFVVEKLTPGGAPPRTTCYFYLCVSTADCIRELRCGFTVSHLSRGSNPQPVDNPVDNYLLSAVIQE